MAAQARRDAIKDEAVAAGAAVCARLPHELLGKSGGGGGEEKEEDDDGAWVERLVCIPLRVGLGREVTRGVARMVRPVEMAVAAEEEEARPAALTRGDTLVPSLRETRHAAWGVGAAG